MVTSSHNDWPVIALHLLLAGFGLFGLHMYGGPNKGAYLLPQKTLFLAPAHPTSSEFDN